MLVLNLSIAWGIMAADHAGFLWARWSLDYSTHTAVALAFVICLGFRNLRHGAYWAASLAAYAGLMVMLGYHSLADIVTTAAVAGSFMLAGGAGCCRVFRSTGCSSPEPLQQARPEKPDK